LSTFSFQINALYLAFFKVKRHDSAGMLLDKILEFAKVTDLSWKTHTHNFILVVKIHGRDGINRQRKEACKFHVKGKRDKDKYNKIYFYLHHIENLWYVLHMASLAPVLKLENHTMLSNVNRTEYSWKSVLLNDGWTVKLDFGLYDEAPLAYIYGIYNVTSSWIEAEQKCQRGGGRLFTLDSSEQWHILTENHHSNYYVDRLFWMAPLIFIGFPQTRKVRPC